MKISLWPSNIIELIKGFGFMGWLILITFIIFCAAVAFPIVHEKHIREKYPIGKHVVIKGTGVEGTISKVNGCGCDIEVMVVDKNGQISKVTVDHKMIDN